MTYCVLDIETVPGKSDWIKTDIAEKIRPPANMKKAETIAKWEDETKQGVIEDKYHSAGLHAETGEIICIGYQFEAADIVIADFKTGNEKQILMRFFNDLFARHQSEKTYPILVGHNLVAFDLPYIWRRAKVHGLEIPSCIKPPVELKPWMNGVFDTMAEWAGIRDRISLDMLCKVFDVPGKDGFSGADVYDAYLAGELNKISDYCADDVKRTHAIYEKIR